MRRLIAMIVACGVLVAGCGKEDDMTVQERAEARAAQARAHIDDLASRVGSAPQVVQDELASCDPSTDEGLDLIYVVHLTADDGSVERLQGEVADHFAAEGWEVERAPGDRERRIVSVRFAKDTFTMGAEISERTGRAVVSGSGGCVR
ncbi:hypothetical protein [Aeromicrobium sp. 179-A 4D2 NHS]|uniref:hypothetical protein n=1 Tax=Aeromicrobium sp. 179-A 4D2 NHS TaxID=3142375 RepID=UPI0039A28704